MRFPFSPPLRQLLLLTVFLLNSGCLFAQIPGWRWANSPGTGLGTSTAVDAAGNMYVAGAFRDTATFGTTTLTSTNGSNDLFVAKLSSNGVWQWAVRAGGTEDDTGADIAVDSSGNVVVTGYFYSSTITFGNITLANSPNVGSINSDIFVAKLTTSGAWQWAVSAGWIANDAGTSVTIADSGNVIVTGGFFSPTIMLGTTMLTNAGNSGSEDSFVGKLTSAGVWQWAQRVGGSGIVSVESMAADGRGNAVLTGYFNSPTLTFGTTTLTKVGLADIFVAKLTPAGTWQWAIRAGENGVSSGIDVTVDGRDNVVLTGGFSGSVITFGTTTLTNAGSRSVFVAKLTPTGVWQWATNSVGTAVDYVQGIAVDGSGNAVVTGYFYSPTITFGTTTLTNAGLGDIFVARLSPAGTWQWATRAGGLRDDYAYCVTTTSSGHAMVTGGFASPTLAFGSTTLTSSGTGSFALFLAGFSTSTTGLPEGSHQPAFTLAPNPARTTVQLTGVTGPTVTLLNGLGRMVGTARVTPVGTATLDLRALPTGLYLVRAGSATRRLVVE